MAVIAWLSPS